MSEVKILLFSHIGNSRQNQEDNAVLNGRYLSHDQIRSFSASNPLFYYNMSCRMTENSIFAVSDGMGGHSSGEIASLKTVCYLAERLAGRRLDKDTLRSEIGGLNQAVRQASLEKSEYRGMGATLCGMCVTDGKLLGFNVGDSRLYRFERGTLMQLSKDHTEGRRLLDLKLLSEEEVKSFPNRKSLYKHIGMRSELVADVFDIDDALPGTIFVLCTDGITDVLSDAEIASILATGHSLKEKGENMIQTAVGRNVGYGDNMSIVMIEF